jgi:hypothetical protein
LIETARCAYTRLEFGEPAHGNFRFQRSIHFFRVLGRAASFRVIVGPTIDADKEIALALQSGENRIRRARGQKTKTRLQSSPAVQCQRQISKVKRAGAGDGAAIGVVPTR